MEFSWDPDVTVARYSPRQTRQARDWLEGRGGHVLTGGLLQQLHAQPEDGYARSSGNSLTEGGIANFRKVLAGHPEGLPLHASHVLIGVGSDSAANAASPAPHGTLSPQLGESPHGTHYQEVDWSFPAAGADGVVRFRVTVPEGDASFPWNEWCIAVAPGLISRALGQMPVPPALAGPYLHQAAPGAVMLNRKAVRLGVKDPEASWVFSCGLRVLARSV